MDSTYISAPMFFFLVLVVSSVAGGFHLYSEMTERFSNRKESKRRRKTIVFVEHAAMQRAYIFLWWSVIGIMFLYLFCSELRLFPTRVLNVLTMVLGSAALGGSVLIEHFEAMSKRSQKHQPFRLRFTLLQLVVLVLGVGAELGVVMDLINSPNPWFVSWLLVMAIPPVTLTTYTMTRSSN